MKVTRQHKILGAVLIVGAIALTSDRLFFLKSPGSEAVANSSSAYALTAAPAKTAAVETAAQSAVATISIAQRLRTAGQSLDTSASRDAFTLGAAWPAPVAAAQQVQAHNSADQFRKAHHLSGVLTSGTTAHAMVDDRILAVGETIDGYRLASISYRSATFEPAEGEPVTLNMNDRAGANPTVSASAVP